jgi:hypothetical protein
MEEVEAERYRYDSKDAHTFLAVVLFGPIPPGYHNPFLPLFSPSCLCVAIYLLYLLMQADGMGRWTYGTEAAAKRGMGPFQWHFYVLSKIGYTLHFFICHDI